MENIFARRCDSSIATCETLSYNECEEVIIDDSLGLATELEEQMGHIVSTYQCEWKTTIEDPEKVKQFSHFVNADSSDDNVVFVREREQIRPATLEEKRVPEEDILATA